MTVPHGVLMNEMALTQISLVFVWLCNRCFLVWRRASMTLDICGLIQCPKWFIYLWGYRGKRWSSSVQMNLECHIIRHTSNPIRVWFVIHHLHTACGSTQISNYIRQRGMVSVIHVNRIWLWKCHKINKTKSRRTRAFLCKNLQIFIEK